MAWPNTQETLPTDIQAQDILGQTGIQHHSMHVQVHTLLNTLQRVLGTGWGDYNNPTFKTVQQRVAGAEAIVPVGAIMAYGGDTPPTGWALCDGSLHGSTALSGIIGSPNTPDLRDRFIVGAGTTFPAEPTPTGGSVTVPIAEANMPTHKHNVSVSSSQSTHAHDDAGGHSHGGWTGGPNVEPLGLQAWDQANWYKGDGQYTAVRAITQRGGDHSHTIPWENNHNHGAVSAGAITNTVSESTKGSSTPLTVKPPYYALVYIIKL